jgi:hypothetical protein
MELYFSGAGYVEVSHSKYIDNIVTTHNITGFHNSPTSPHLFETRDDDELLEDDKRIEFHSLVAKLLYIGKKARPDILVPVGFLTTRVLKPTIYDWGKCVHVCMYLNHTKMIPLRLGANEDPCVEIYIDASHGVYEDRKSISGIIVTIGRGAVYSSSVRQRIVTTSSTEAELVAISDGLGHALWTRNFYGSLGYSLPPVILYQDNQSTILLATNGRSSAGRTRHVDIRYFWIKDRVQNGEVIITYLPTEDMAADMLTKHMKISDFLANRRILLAEY